MQTTGINDQRIAGIARDNLRIAAYLDQRFGTAVQVSDEEVAAYYRAHEAEFTRGGVPMPFEEAEPVARQRVSNERRRTIIDQWIGDLRLRADIAVNDEPRIPDGSRSPDGSRIPDSVSRIPDPASRPGSATASTP